MSSRSVTMFQVGNGNCSLFEVDGAVIAIDLCGTEKKRSYDLLKPFLRVEGKQRHLDILCITHGDKDHCGGFTDFKNEIDAGRLIIGSIWHPNYDRTKVDGVADLPDDYLALHKEIMRRRAVAGDEYGDSEVPLTAWDDESDAFRAMEVPEDFALRVLSPYVKDEGDTDWDVNDISLVVRFNISGLTLLYPGDSGARTWQDRILPYTLDQKDKADWGEAEILLASHHGSYSFFGEDRDSVVNADPFPENYPALDRITPKHLIVSAATRFPTSKDESGDEPPHYAAWKWYHKWFRENRDVGASDKHPSVFKYTADGDIRLELGDNGWEWVNDWSPPDNGPGGKGAAAIGFTYRGGETKRSGGHYAGSG